MCVWSRNVRLPPCRNCVWRERRGPSCGSDGAAAAAATATATEHDERRTDRNRKLGGRWWRPYTPSSSVAATATDDDDDCIVFHMACASRTIYKKKNRVLRWSLRRLRWCCADGSVEHSWWTVKIIIITRSCVIDGGYLLPRLPYKVYPYE